MSAKSAQGAGQPPSPGSQCMENKFRTGTGGSQSAGARKGFTFTISVLIVALTLITVAAYSKEKPKSLPAANPEIVSQEAALLAISRISSDFSAMLRASAAAKPLNATHSEISLSVSLPLSKEGQPVLSDLNGYSRLLARVLAPQGIGAVVSAERISGKNNATVMHIGEGGIDFSNTGHEDIAVFRSPPGWRPLEADIAISCDRSSSAMGPIRVVNSTPFSGSGPTYAITYEDNRGARGFSAPSASTSTASFLAEYPDGGYLRLTSTVSDSNEGNAITVQSAKSPSARLVLPFDAEDGAGLDYSQAGASMTPGGSSPDWLFDGGKYYGAYAFDSNDALYASGLSMTDVPAEAHSEERILNSGMENQSGGVPSQWAVSGMPSGLSQSAHTGGFSLNLTYNATSGVNASQVVRPILENSEYAFSFWVKSAASGRYAITDGTNYLQSDGSWAASQNFFTTPRYSYFSQVRKQFKTPGNASSITVFLASPPSSGFALYDDVSLKAVQFNGGFESYYKDSGPSYAGLDFPPGGPG